MIRALLALIALALSAPAQYVNLTGSLADSPEPRVLAEGEVASIAYTMPRMGPELPPWRLQSVLPAATVRLVVDGEATTDATWMSFGGFESWWSVGAPAESPDAPHAWGSAIKGYSYGGVGDGDYFGAGMISTITSAKLIDPRVTRWLRAFIGTGEVTLYLNCRRVVHAFGDSHWQHEVTVSVQPVVSTLGVTFRYAEPGQTVFAHTVGAWGDVAWSWSEASEHMALVPGSSQVAFPASGSTVAQVSAPGLPGSGYYGVSVQIEERAYILNGVENLGDDEAVCGGNSLVFGMYGSHYGTGFNVGVGSMQVGMTAHDGTVDWDGPSGERNASESYSTGFGWIHGASPGGFDVEMRLQGSATFIPESPYSRIAWSAQAALRGRARYVGTEIVQ